jgi:membrane fusion protein, heavy metal efflux system
MNRSRHRMRRPTKAVVVCLPLFLFLSIVACNKEPASTAEAAHPAGRAQPGEIVLSAEEQATAKIETQPAKLSDQTDVLRVAGRITLADTRTWHVGVRTEGLVVAVSAGLGDYVKKGQVLARYRAQEALEARAQYRTARSELARAEATAALAQHNSDRMQRLLNLKAASVLQTEQARQDLESAQAGVRGAQIEVDRARTVLENELHVAVDAQPGDDTADQVPIIAPAAGYIIKKLITPGKIVQPSADSFVIGDLSQVWMLASVRQEDLGKLRVGQPATVTLRGSHHAYHGKITNLGQELDPATRVMQVRIVLNNSDNHLRPEMLVNAEIPVGSGKPMLIVPPDAIQQINEQDVVFVRAASDRFVVRPVQIGEAVQEGVPVLDGLKQGEAIVTRGAFALKSQLLRASIEE